MSRMTTWYPDRERPGGQRTPEERAARAAALHGPPIPVVAGMRGISVTVNFAPGELAWLPTETAEQVLRTGDGVLAELVPEGTKMPRVTNMSGAQLGQLAREEEEEKRKAPRRKKKASSHEKGSRPIGGP